MYGQKTSRFAGSCAGDSGRGILPFESVLNPCLGMTASEIQLLWQHSAHEHCAGGLACRWIFLGTLPSRKSSGLTNLADESWQNHSKGFVPLLEQAEEFRGIRSDPWLVKITITLAKLQLQTIGLTPLIAQLCRLNGRRAEDLLTCYSYKKIAVTSRNQVKCIVNSKAKANRTAITVTAWVSFSSLCPAKVETLCFMLREVNWQWLSHLYWSQWSYNSLFRHLYKVSWFAAMLWTGCRMANHFIWHKFTPWLEGPHT